MQPSFLFTHLLAVCAVLLATSCSTPEKPLSSTAALISPAGPNSAEPHLERLGTDGALLSWLEVKDGGATLLVSELEDKAWQPPRVVATGTNWFVNWADFPSVTPISESYWAAHWLVKSHDSPYAYDVAIATSKDAGKTWSVSTAPHSDNTKTEHGFVSLFPHRGQLGAIWLDGRNMAEGGHGNDHDHHGSGDMTLRGAIIDDQLQNTADFLVDEMVCECCQTDAVSTATGAVAVYRNRTADEIRDIFVTRFDGTSWSEGQPVSNDGWQIAGCPVNGPAIAALDNRVAVAWFSAADNQPKVRFAQSDDGGETFSEAVDIDSIKPIGRVDITAVNHSTMVVSWVRQAAGETGEVVLLSVIDGAKSGEPIVVTEISTSRPSGFPQMIKVDEDLLFAWTEISEQGSQVKTRLLSISSFIQSGAP